MNKMRRNPANPGDFSVQGNPLSKENGYGNKKLPEPTRSGFSEKLIPDQMKGYEAVNPEKAEWKTIKSVVKGGK